MDILAAFEELDQAEKQKKAADEHAAKRKGSRTSTISKKSTKTASHKNIPANSTATKTRPHSLPLPNVDRQNRLTPVPTRRTSYEASSRSHSVGADSRRISFADPPRPSARRIWIPTKNTSLGSGFPYDARLGKYGVMDKEWSDFSDDLVDAAQVSTKSWQWHFQRKDVIKRLKKELQYEGDFKRMLRRWNKHFKRRGFQVWLELPAGKDEADKAEGSIKSGSDLGSEDEEKRQSLKEKYRYRKRFRVVVSSGVEKGSSVYSRSSSLTRSVMGEGAAVQQETSGLSADEKDDLDDDKEK